VKKKSAKKNWKLAQQQKSLDSASGCVNDIVEANLDYAGFLEQIKQKAIRGRIKQKIFDIIGVFSWRQCQVNIGLYEALVSQKAEIGRQRTEIESQKAEIERQRTEIEQQKALALSGDKVLAELDYKFSMLSRAEDTLYQELVDRRGEISKSSSAIMDLLNQRIAEIKRSIKAMDTVKDDNATGRAGLEMNGKTKDKEEIMEKPV
jgi:hypothetical protein